MSDKPQAWDQHPEETPKAYAAFLEYVALGSARSVREAARQHHAKTASTGSQITTVQHWLRWSAKHKWVSRGIARDEWIARTSDEQIIANLAAFKLELTTRGREFLKSKETGDFLRASRAVALHFPPVQRVEDVTQIEDLSHLTDEQLQEMRKIRDSASKEKEK